MLEVVGAVRERKEVGLEGVSKWVLACLLRGADIIKHSPCILPLFSSKGMLAQGSSASYCVALAEKGLCREGVGEQAVFPIYSRQVG